MRRFIPRNLLRGSRATRAGALLADATGLPTFQELRPRYEWELRRARRYERPLSVLAVRLRAADANPEPMGLHTPAPGNGSGPNLDRKRSSRAGAGAADRLSRELQYLLLGNLLHGTLRETDLVGGVAELHEYIALLPECDRVSAEGLVARVNRLMIDRTRTGIRAGAATYPEGGLTLDDLVATARNFQSDNGAVVAVVGSRYGSV